MKSLFFSFGKLLKSNQLCWKKFSKDFLQDVCKDCKFDHTFSTIGGKVDNVFTNSSSTFPFFISFTVQALTTGGILENLTAHCHLLRCKLSQAGTQTQQLED